MARRDATESCLSTARRQLTTNQKIKAITVETESSVGYHEEVSEDVSVSGLTCVPKREAYENTATSFRVWLLCDYDIKKAKVIERTNPPDEQWPSANNADIENRIALKKLNTDGQLKKNPRSIVSSQQNIVIVSVPPCESIIIRGTKPRTLACKTNPVTLLIYSDDEEAIVRAPGYLPKTIKFKSGGQINEPVQVLLDRM